MEFRERIVLGVHGLPSGVTSASQVKKMGAGAFTEAVPRLAPKAHTNGFTQAQASDGHVRGWVTTKNCSLQSPGKSRNAKVCGLCRALLPSVRDMVHVGGFRNGLGPFVEF